MFAYVCWSELLRSQANCQAICHMFSRYGIGSSFMPFDRLQERVQTGDAGLQDSAGDIPKVKNESRFAS